MIIDSHCHLDFPELQHNILTELQDAQRSGVVAAQTICVKISEFDKIYDITQIEQNFIDIFCSVGNHPAYLHEESPATCDEIVTLTKKDKVIGIGETGLDYYHSKLHAPQQRRSFIEHIHAAQETGLPLIIHTRDAEEDTVQILSDEMKNKPFKGLIHCMTGSRWLAEKCLEMGLYISASGIITFKNAQTLRDTFSSIPLNRILIETDAPFLAPAPYRGKTNSPKYVQYVAHEIAKIHNIEYANVAETTSDNFMTLFEKAVLTKNTMPVNKS